MNCAHETTIHGKPFCMMFEEFLGSATDKICGCFACIGFDPEEEEDQSKPLAHDARK